MNRFNSKELHVGDNVIITSVDEDLISMFESPGINSIMKTLVGKKGYISSQSSYNNCFRVQVDNYNYIYHKKWLKVDE